MSLNTGLIAQGTTQANALPLRAEFNSIATVAVGSGVILGSNVSRGDDVNIRNLGANPLSVYPPVGYTIVNGAVNAPVTLAAGAVGRYFSDGAGSFI